jgi:hypothetical protein
MSYHEGVAAGGAALRTGGLALQRACACGSHAAGGQCEACKRKKSMLQRRDRGAPDPVARAAGADRRAAGGVAMDLSGVAARGIHAAPALRTGARVQRQGLEDAPPVAAPEAAPAAPEAAPAPESIPSAEPRAEPETTPGAAAEPGEPAAAGALIAEDGATALQPGQMRKTEFLDQLERAVCAQADAALAASGRSTEGCPYLSKAFGHYRGQSGARVESALRRYAPETRGARSAAEAIPLIAARVRQGVERWAATGQVTGVPDDLPMEVPGLAGLGGMMGSIGAAVGGMFFKARDGGARADDDPAAVRASLGAGRPLEAGVRGRMEQAFGQSFAQVRTHTDANAGQVSARQNARAFTVGRDVAFGSGEYRPGTPVGDALIAHELAHVVQQGGASPETQAKAASGPSYGALERDADDAAVGVVSALWGGAKGGLAKLAGGAGASLKSGLRLQRCSRDQDKTPKTTDPAALCDEPRCLARSGCSGGDCKAEAKVLSDTYVKRVNAIRRPDMPNRQDIHWGWLCYEWAGLLAREFEKLGLKCWQVSWVGIVSDSSGALEHNYIFASLGAPQNDGGPVRDCGLILDPWRTGTPVVYGGEWDWHKWNYMHNTRDDTGKVYKDGKWTPVVYPGPWTPDEPAPRGP